MSRFHILAVGKLKEKWMQEGCREYQKRLSAWGGAAIAEIKEAALPAMPSLGEIAQGIKKEGELLLQKLPQGARVIALCIEGKQMSSEKLAGYLEESAGLGIGGAVFLIGSSFGLSEQVKEKADLCLSMSPMTFPHQLARLMLLEQLYRAMTIIDGMKYHK